MSVYLICLFIYLLFHKWGVLPSRKKQPLAGGCSSCDAQDVSPAKPSARTWQNHRCLPQPVQVEQSSGRCVLLIVYQMLAQPTSLHSII